MISTGGQSQSEVSVKSMKVQIVLYKVREQDEIRIARLKHRKDERERADLKFISIRPCCKIKALVKTNAELLSDFNLK